MGLTIEEMAAIVDNPGLRWKPPRPQERPQGERVRQEAEYQSRKTEERVQQEIEYRTGKAKEAQEIREALAAVNKPKPVVVAEPLTCFVAALGEFGEWGLCATFLNSLDDESQPVDICSQCPFGYQNPYWLAGRVHQVRASHFSTPRG